MVLGMLQLLMMQQARYLAQVAAFKSARAGSLASGDCTRMTHAAVGVLLPTFTSFLAPGAPALDATLAGHLVRAFQLRSHNVYEPTVDKVGDVPLNGPIVWVERLSPAPSGRGEDESFDDPDRGQVLSVQLTFWYPLRIPFANWVISRIALASWGGMAMTGVNPLLVTQKANWRPGGYTPGATVVDEMSARYAAQQFVFPIRTSFAMKMLTPPRLANFAGVRCPVPLP